MAGTTWTLAAPDWADLDTVWRNPLPFVLWPVGNQPLLGHWMDEAVHRGVGDVELWVADRPAAVRAWLQGGAYWSRHAKVMERDSGAPPAEAIGLDTLPDYIPETLPQTPEQLLEHYFALQRVWLDRYSPTTVSIETRHLSGGWIGRHARVHPTARLEPPFWVGPYAEIGAHCRVGPYALVGEKCVLDENAEIDNGYVLAHTYVGRNVRVSRSIADGPLMIDFGRGCRLDIAESFILSRVVSDAPGLHSLRRLRGAVGRLFNRRAAE